MNMTVRGRWLGLIVAVLTGWPAAHAAIIVTPTTNATQIASALTAGGGAGIAVTSVELKAHALPNGEASSGVYSLTGPFPDTYGMALPGIILSSGNVANYGTGPNSTPSQSTSFGVAANSEQEALLDPITGNAAHFDCTQLDITFNTLPGFGNVFFQVVFGSEEYPEFVNSPFNDGFGLFLNGTNIAAVAGAPINIKHPGMAAVAGTQLDGVLTPGGTNSIMTFFLSIGPNVTGNKLTIILSDTADNAYDTTVYVMALGGGTPEPPAVECTPQTQLAQHPDCITRPARFWFSHSETNDPNCVTLKRAIEANGGQVCLGFQTLPVEYQNDDNVKDAGDAMIEALGLYWRGQKSTGEDRGTQTLRLPGSKLCRERKRLAVELIAAQANNALLGTAPGNCSYYNGVTQVNFPSDLIELAGAACRGDDILQVRLFTALLQKFNNSGVTNDFPVGLFECSEVKAKVLRKLAKDPTTQTTCPGINDRAATAESIVSFPFKQSVDLTKYSNAVGPTDCGDGGVDAVWKIKPEEAILGSQFTAKTSGSNIQPMVSVWKSDGDLLSLVNCDAPTVGEASVSFTADGTSTYYIVAEGASGGVGKFKLQVTAP
ncbi:MAG: hypothetical protein PCFJNLEI_03217 [Verrucomicrobiae bacterium]|nr:hypothetical protein [Verrucomicrobiae bacterium]